LGVSLPTLSTTVTAGAPAQPIKNKTTNKKFLDITFI